MACANCPCASVCLARPIWCEWMATPPVDPVIPRHICDVSRGGPYAPVSVRWLPPELAADGALRTLRDLPPGATGRGGCCG